MTKLDLPRLLKDTEGATPGPWHPFISMEGFGTFAVFGPGNCAKNPVIEWTGFDGPRRGKTRRSKNCILAAYAPAMRDELIRLTEERDRLVEALEASAKIIDRMVEDHSDYVFHLYYIDDVKDALEQANTTLKQVRGE